MATLPIDDGRETAVWRLVKARLQQAGNALDRAGARLLFFSDVGREAAADLDTQGGTVLRFFPVMGRRTWYSEAAHAGTLTVAVEAVIDRLDEEDVLNLNAALFAVLDTYGDPAFQQSLVDAGASTGLILPADPLKPAAGRKGQDGLFRLTGAFQVDVTYP